MACSDDVGPRVRKVRDRGWRYKGIVVPAGLAAGGYLAASLWGGWDDVAAATAQIGVSGIVVALALSLLNYALRFTRWQMYLAAMGHRLPWPEHVRVYLAGFALTTTPGKVGEAMRSVFLRPWGVGSAESLAALVSERLSDLMAIMLLTLVGLLSYPARQDVVLVGAAVVALALLVLSQGSVIRSLHQRSQNANCAVWRWLHHLTDILLKARRCHGMRLALTATALSMVAWGAEALAFYWVLGRLSADVPFVFAMFVYALSMLAGSLSLMPGGLGGTEAVMVSLLVWKGMLMPDAVATTVVIRLATLWFAVALGLLALMRSGEAESR